MTSPPDPSRDEILLRLELLERENQRLREKLEPLFGKDNPNFDSMKFLRALSRALFIGMLPLVVLPALIGPAIAIRPKLLGSIPSIGPVPLVDFAGIQTRHPGLGFGVIAFGGAAAGGIAIGGLGIGLLAIGGGAIGAVAVGGGSFGFIALGGGACGYIAVGGGAVGVYAMGRNAYGRHVLAINRQDPEAIEFFCKWVPGLRAAVTNPMPVLPLPQPPPKAG